MLEFIIDLTRIIVGIISGLAFVYCLVRLSAIAWHRTKHEYDDEKYPERKRQNNEEL